MRVDEWFQSHTLLARIIFIIIPFIGWIIELLVRISAVIRKPSGINIAGLVVFAILGGFWILCLFDVICLFIYDRLILFE